MRLRRTNTALAIAVALLVAAEFALRPAPPLARGTGERVFPALIASDVRTIRIRGAGGDTVELELAGKRWTLPAQHGFPATPHVVEALLTHLPRTADADHIASGSGADFGFPPPGGTGEAGRAGETVSDAVDVELRDGDGNVVAAFAQVSAPAPAGGGAPLGSLVRAQGSAHIHRTALIAPLIPRATAWLELSLANVAQRDPRDALALDVQAGGNAALSAVRDGDAGSRWIATVPREKELGRIAIDKLLAILGRLYLAELEAGEPAPEHGFEAPALEFNLRFADERTLRLLFAKGPDDTYRVTSPDWARPWVVRVPARSVGEAVAALDGVLATLR